MTKNPFLQFVLLCGFVGFAVCSAYGDSANPEQLEFFEKQVRPILVKHCYACHSHQSEKLKAGLLLDSRTGLLRGGDSGPAIVPSDSKSSLLVTSIQFESFEMPPKGKLPEAEIQTLVKWIDQGAFWPNEPEPTSNSGKPAFNLIDRKSSHWAWQPIVPAKPPEVKNAAWLKNDIDAFILAKLESSALSPVKAVDRRGLLRRLYFDLIGLPPTLEQLSSFLDDQSSESIETVVDQLLDSPHFGERWGRHWLDLVRYSESRGHEFDSDVENAYQYRDYVIRALNADLPYDQFVREQIAGDLLNKPRLHPIKGFNESIIGTGFWYFGEWVHSPVDIRKDETDRFDNMIDVMSKTFLGATIACARCHDHKFDAISSRDYYALSGFLQSSDYRQVRFETIEQDRIVAEELEKIDQRYRIELQDKLYRLLDKLADQPQPDQEGEPTQFVKWDRKKATKQAPRTLVDYRKIDRQDYVQDGFIFGARPILAGDLLIEKLNGKSHLSIAPISAARSDPFWHGIVNESEAPTHINSGIGLEIGLRSGRTLRSPTIELKTGDVHVQLRGSGLVVACVDSYRQIGGPLHKETVLEIKPSDGKDNNESTIRWHTMKLARYLGHRAHFEFTPSENKVLEVLQVVEEMPLTKDIAFGTEASVKKSEPSQEKLLTVREALVAWHSGKFDDEIQTSNWIARLNQWIDRHFESDNKDDPDSIAIQKIVAEWNDARDRLASMVHQKSQLAMAMLDGGNEDDHVLIRGSSANPGDLVPRRFLEAIDGERPLNHQTRSGRLELADRINDESNPLTTRVIVNRIWHHLLGRGIVPTTDDFGVLGQPPTHPELLDYLAVKFRNNGQSIKQMIRMIVLSQSYQMSSAFSADAVAQDPKNLLWHHIPPKRLEGEAIRDALLVLAGNLNPEPFGPSVPIYLTDFMDGRGRPKKSGPSDGDGRRSIYIAVRRNFLSPFMLTFDTPSPFSTMGRRNVSNVPAQALILMNDPFVATQAKGIAVRAIIENSQVLESRVRWLYELMFARLPSDGELSLTLEFAQQQTEAQKTIMTDSKLWTDVVHALINTKEFIFLR